jgi:hypothetical protein
VTTGEVVSIAMVRAALDGVPEHPMAAGYTIRRYEPGDERTWTDIWRRSDTHGLIDEQTFAREFGADPTLLADRQLFLLDSHGNAVGTATA